MTAPKQTIGEKLDAMNKSAKDKADHALEGAKAGAKDLAYAAGKEMHAAGEKLSDAGAKIMDKNG